MSDDRTHGKELKDEDLDKVSGGVNADATKAGGKQNSDYLSVKKVGPAP